jgi:exopolysaccharide production protein ExoZ
MLRTVMTAPRLASETPALQARDTVENVQALRGIAALLVIWAHLKFPVQALVPGAERIPFIAAGNGAMGVDLFFCISGFVISIAACKRHYGPLEFFAARLARVCPLYFCFVLFYVGSKWISTDEARSYAALWNGFFYLPIFDFHHLSLPPGAMGWSLCFEMWFYVAFALLLNIWPPVRVAFFLPIVFAIGAPLMSFYRGGWYFPAFIFHPFTIDFAAGCVIFQLQRFLAARWAWALLAAAGFYLLAFTRHSGYLALSNNSGDVMLAWTRVLLWGVPSMLVLAGLVGLERGKLWTAPRWLAGIGTISYSLYLSQWPTMRFIQSLGPRVHLHNLTALLILTPLLCLVVGWLAWKCVEVPLTRRAQALAHRLTRGR